MKSEHKDGALSSLWQSTQRTDTCPFQVGIIMIVITLCDFQELYVNNDDSFTIILIFFMELVF